MELTYTTAEALQGKRFMASQDPSFSDIRDYLTLPSTPILGTSDVRQLKHLPIITSPHLFFLVCSCKLFDFPQPNHFLYTNSKS